MGEGGEREGVGVRSNSENQIGLRPPFLWSVGGIKYKIQNTKFLVKIKTAI